MLTIIKNFIQAQKRQVKTPTILQMEVSECGAAALAIILAYHGKHISLEEVRQACGVSRNGSKAINIVKAARAYGMSANGVKVEPQALTQLTLPCIVHWELNHFVVVEALQDDVIFINDPATGPRTVTWAEFDKAFSGIAINLAPSADFKPSGKPAALINSIYPRLFHAKQDLKFILLASLMLIVPGIAIPGFSKIFVDNVLIGQFSNWIKPLLVGMAFTALLKSLLTWVQQNALLRLRIKLGVINSVRFLWHILHLPMIFFAQRFTGDIVERVNANERMAELLSNDLSTAIVSLFTMGFYALVMLLISWPIALISIFFTGLNALLFYMIARKMADASRLFLQERGKLLGIIMNGLQLIELVKASAAEHEMFKRWVHTHAKTINTQQEIASFEQLLLVLPKLFNGLNTIILLGLGSWLIMRGNLTAGSLVAMQSLLANFQEPIQTLLDFGTDLQKIRGDLARLDDVLHYPVESRAHLKDDKNVLLNLQGNIHLNNVTFGYAALEPPLIQNLTLEITGGKRIAIVGKSGCGKSTFAKLLTGLYQPWQGEIYFDEFLLANFSPGQLAQQVAMVDQDIFLFEGTIRDNLTLWDKTITDEHILTIIEDLGLTEMISYHGGLNSPVAENGHNFSGGQKQCLEVIRALIHHPKIIVLDEATANLDSVLEKQIYDKLKKRNCTLIIIAHRLSAIRDCDEILVLEQGQIVQRGTHSILIDQDGLYRQLIVTE